LSPPPFLPFHASLGDYRHVVNVGRNIPTSCSGHKFVFIIYIIFPF
jgi:hypothetical protein